MYLKHLSLTNFRNYARLEVELPARIHIFQGENAQGKTNLLESIYYLATTKSPLASSDRQLMHWDAGQEVIPHTDMRATYVRGGDEHTLEAILVKDPPANGDPQNAVFKRQILLDGVPRRALDVVGRLNVVLFLPQDISLVSGSPAERRRYLDVTLCQIDSQYCRSLSRYNRVMTQRNALLRSLREGYGRSDELAYWDEQLTALGAYVLARRLETVDDLSRMVDPIQQSLTGGQEHLSLDYQNSLTERPTDGVPLPDAENVGDEERWARIFAGALRQARGEEIARGVTVVGPHRDDMRFILNGVDATVYGSRGQQRTAALALKLAEVGVMERHAGEMPILLLDDVLSELDLHRGYYLMETISRAQQVLVTTTHLRDYTPEFLEAAMLWCVKAGTLRPLEADEVGE